MYASSSFASNGFFSYFSQRFFKINPVESHELVMNVFEEIDRREHEQIVFCSDRKVGLHAIIAVHNTALGPSLGGTRMWMYLNEEEALRDVLRLSKGMTYKAAIAGLNLGGGHSNGAAQNHESGVMM